MPSHRRFDSQTRGRSEQRSGRSAEEATLYGLHAIGAWLEARPERLRVLHFDARGGAEVQALAARARASRVSVQATAADDLANRCGGKRHQGVVAECAPFPYVEIAVVAAAAPRLVVAVDQLQDPHNLGAILRSAEAAGAGGLLAPRDNCVGVTATVEATSAGTSAWLPVCRVTNLTRGLGELKEHGYWVVGLSGDAAVDLFTFTPPDRVVLLIGGEGGLRPLVERQVDFPVRIPMAGHAESLNASVAAAIGLFELARKWRAT